MTAETTNKKLIFTSKEFEEVTKYLIGSNSIKQYPSIIVPQCSGPARIQSKPELFVQNAMESCPVKSVMSLIVGGALGAFMGLFSSSIAPHHTHQVECNKQNFQKSVFLPKIKGGQGKFCQSPLKKLKL